MSRSTEIETTKIAHKTILLPTAHSLTVQFSSLLGRDNVNF